MSPDPDPIGKITLVILLFATFIVGAFISYLWVLGYCIAFGLEIPKKPAVAVSDFTLSPQDPSFFNVSVLNPSFSPSDAKVLEISVLTEDGVIHRIRDTYPSIPTQGYTLQVGQTKTFNCYWNWANYTGQRLKVIIFVDEGSGGTFQATLPPVSIAVTDFGLDPMFGDRFNLTLRNSANSATYINVTKVTVITNAGAVEIANIEPALPRGLDADSSVNLLCYMNWTDYQNETIKIRIDTLQSYIALSAEAISTYVTLNIEEVAFNATDTSHFNLTVINSETSVISVNITRITITLENGTVLDPSPITPTPPYVLDKNATVTFLCAWNWTEYRDKDVTVVIYTSEGYKASAIHKTPM